MRQRARPDLWEPREVNSRGHPSGEAGGEIPLAYFTPPSTVIMYRFEPRLQELPERFLGSDVHSKYNRSVVARSGGIVPRTQPLTVVQ